MQVYTVLYERSGCFLLARKPLRGYYFKNPAVLGGGEVIRAGEGLHGGGNYALPGGRKEAKESIVDAGLREFQEETGVPIFGLPYKDYAFPPRYAAVYVESHSFNAMANRIIANLKQGTEAATQVSRCEIDWYPDIFTHFHHAPPDNELSEGSIWNLEDPTQWQAIEDWQGDPIIGWYYEILNYLKTSILTPVGMR